MKLLCKILLTFLLTGLLIREDVQASCCNAGFLSAEIPSVAKNQFRFIMLDSTDTSIQSVKWSFGDSTYSNERTPLHVYYATGNYPVTLTVIKNTIDGVLKTCSETRLISVSYQCPDFTAITTSLTVSFSQTTGLSFDSISSLPVNRVVRWTMGDGGYSFELNPIHTYAQSGTYNVCLYQGDTNSSDVLGCEVCHTIVVTDTTPVVCRSDFSYSLTDTLVSLYANSPGGDSYWWIKEDSTVNAWGSHVYLVAPTKDSFTVCHRKYTDSIPDWYSNYCTECNIIRTQTPVDTIATQCNSDFTYTLKETKIILNALESATHSYWWYMSEKIGYQGIYSGGDTIIHVPATGGLTVCHKQYNINDNTFDTCIVCKVVREIKDTIPAVCNSDFGYTVNGLTISAYADSISNGRRIWNFDHRTKMYDTLLASYTFNSAGIKRICQTAFYEGSTDSCTTCKDILIDEANVIIHPNPATAYITIKSKEGLISSIDIYDIHGTFIKNALGLNVIRYNMNVSDLTSGIYYVSTMLEDRRVNRTKIIIQ